MSRNAIELIHLMIIWIPHFIVNPTNATLVPSNDCFYSSVLITPLKVYDREKDSLGF